MYVFFVCLIRRFTSIWRFIFMLIFVIYNMILCYKKPSKQWLMYTPKRRVQTRFDGEIKIICSTSCMLHLFDQGQHDLWLLVYLLSVDYRWVSIVIVTFPIPVFYCSHRSATIDVCSSTKRAKGCAAHSISRTQTITIWPQCLWARVWSGERSSAGSISCWVVVDSLRRGNYANTVWFFSRFL